LLYVCNFERKNVILFVGNNTVDGRNRMNY
jgi:hypothetical protein